MPEEPRPFDPNTFIQSLVQKAGGADQAILQLGTELRRMRVKYRKASEELEALRTRNPANSIVLTGDDVSLWNGLAPVIKEKKVTTAEAMKAVFNDAAEASTLRTKVTGLEMDSMTGAAASEMSMNYNVLRQILGDKGLRPVKADVIIQKEDGTEGKESRWHVIPVGDPNATPVRLEESSAVKPFLKSLMVEEADTGSGGDNDEPAQRLPAQRQSAKGTSHKRDVVGETLNARYAPPKK